MQVTVMFVGGDAGATASLKRRLRRDSHRVLEASSGQHALEMCAATPVDVLVCDEVTPGMSGLEMMADASRLHPDVIRVLLVRAAGAAAAAQVVREGLAHRYFVKPVEPTDFAAGIRQALAQRPAAGGRGSRSVSQADVLRTVLEGRHPGITDVRRDDDEAVIIDGEDFETVEMDVEPRPPRPRR